MARALARHDHPEDPPWIDDPGAARAPHTMYVRTYEAIAASHAGNHGGLRAWARVVGWLFALAAVGAVAMVVRRQVTIPWPWARPAVPVWVAPAEPAQPVGPALIAAAPVGPKASVRVGETLDFAVVAGGRDLRFGWSVDGNPAGMGPRWTYVPEAGAVGRHRIDVGVADRRGTAVQSWVVRVRPARPPQIMNAEPARDVIEVERGEPVRLSVGATAGSPDEQLRTTWTVDGAPAGEGASVAVHPSRAGMVAVRAVVTSNLGGTATRAWQVRVLEPPPPAPAPPEPAADAAVPPPLPIPRVRPGGIL